MVPIELRRRHCSAVLSATQREIELLAIRRSRQQRQQVTQRKLEEPQRSHSRAASAARSGGLWPRTHSADRVQRSRSGPKRLARWQAIQSPVGLNPRPIGLLCMARIREVAHRPPQSGSQRRSAALRIVALNPSWRSHRTSREFPRPGAIFRHSLSGLDRSRPSHRYGPFRARHRSASDRARCRIPFAQTMFLRRP